MSYQLLPPAYYYGNDRARFTIPLSDFVLQDPDIYIGNMGSYISNLPASVDPANITVKYPLRSGVLSSIKSAVLRINDKAVEVVEDVGEIAAINNLEQLNSLSYNVQSQMLKTRNTFKIEAGKIDFKDNNYNVTNAGVNTFNTLTQSESTTPTGAFSLSLIFGCLRQMIAQTPKVLIYSKYQSVTIDLIFETDPFKMNISGADIVVAKKADLSQIQLSATRPVLIIKKYSSPALIEEYKQLYNNKMIVNFLQWGKDEALIPAPATATGLTSLEFRQKEMIGKTVASCVVQNKYEFDSYATTYKDAANADRIGNEVWNSYCGNLDSKQYSVPNTNESLQLNINGRLFFPNNGIDSPALKALYRDQVYEHLQLLPLADVPTTDANAGKYMTQDVVFADKLMSYYAIPINMKPNDWKVQYSKNAAATDFLNNANYNANCGLQQKQIWRFQFQKELILQNNVVLIGNV